jgi:hypothetical protein
LVTNTGHNIVAGITQELQKMSGVLDQALADLGARVQANSDATSSAVQLISGIPAMIKTAVDAALAAGATPQELTAISDLGATIQANADKLGAAVTANTTAA